IIWTCNTDIIGLFLFKLNSHWLLNKPPGHHIYRFKRISRVILRVNQKSVREMNEFTPCAKSKCYRRKGFIAPKALLPGSSFFFLFNCLVFFPLNLLKQEEHLLISRSKRFFLPRSFAGSLFSATGALNSNSKFPCFF